MTVFTRSLHGFKNKLNGIFGGLKASLLEPVDPILTDHLGDVYWANGRKREAEYQWRRALSYAPSDKDAARIQQKLDKGLDAVMADEGTPLIPAK